MLSVRSCKFHRNIQNSGCTLTKSVFIHRLFFLIFTFLKSNRSTISPIWTPCCRARSLAIFRPACWRWHQHQNLRHHRDFKKAISTVDVRTIDIQAFAQQCVEEPTPGLFGRTSLKAATAIKFGMSGLPGAAHGSSNAVYH